MPTSSGATPPPANWPAAPVKGENKLSPKGGTRGATGSCGVPSEDACCVSLVASLLEGVPAEPPARVLKTSAVALATLVAALWTVPTVLPNAPAALVPRLDERRRASPTAGAAGTAAATKAAAGLLLVIVVRGAPPPHGAAHGAIGAVAGSVTSPRTSAARPSEAAGST